MAPKMHLFTAFRRLAVQPRPACLRAASRTPNPPFLRHASTSKSPQSDLPVTEGDGAVGPNMQQQEHVSEEAAKMAKITGGEGPDLSQGTPVQDILKEEKEARQDAPQVIKDSIKAGSKPPKPQSRPFSTYTRRRQELDAQPSPEDYSIQASMMPSRQEIYDAAGEEDVSLLEDESEQGHKFGLPTLPIPARMHKDYRYEPIVEQVTNLMMRHGEKAKAQRNMAHILEFLRTAPPPKYNPQRPLLPGAPPAAHLPLNPVLYLTLALDSLAPLLRLRSQRGAAGGGAALQIPIPLGQRQRRRQSFMWILDSASKKQNKGTGRGDFARRIAEEIVAVVEGRSALWERRTGVHKIATTARSNLNFSAKGRR